MPVAWLAMRRGMTGKLPKTIPVGATPVLFLLVSLDMVQSSASTESEPGFQQPLLFRKRTVGHGTIHPGEILYFHHVMKTGGTSVSDMLLNGFGTGALIPGSGRSAHFDRQALLDSIATSATNSTHGAAAINVTATVIQRNYQIAYSHSTPRIFQKILSSSEVGIPLTWATYVAFYACCAYVCGSTMSVQERCPRSARQYILSIDDIPQNAL